MTDTETRSVLRILQSAYPQRYRKMPKADADELVRQWSALDPFPEVKAAVDNWISSQRFHPTVADIRAIMSGPSDGESMRAAFKSMLRFRISQLQDIIMNLGQTESETDGKQVEKARQKLDEIYAKYGHILEG